MARILLAEDEQQSRDLVRRALEGDGHAVTVMASGIEALDRLTSGPADFDVLVSDINMPGLDGVELAGQALRVCPGLALVLMSGFVEQLERSKSLATTRIAVVAKPFTLEQMRATVRSVLA
jgi:two-component system, cell cycle response regulator CpdR